MSEAQETVRPFQKVIGLMSGTSLDGVDAAWLETDGITVRSDGPSLTLPYDPALRRRLRALLDRAPTYLPGVGPDEDPDLQAIIHDLTMRHVMAVEAVTAQAGMKADLIGFHGQTVLHAPDQGLTWQIGDANLLARCTGVDVVADFRSADVKAGGQGAPLVPVYHAALAGHLALPVAFLNIGGVANVTWIGPSTAGRESLILAGDTGPGNALLDDWALRHTGTPCDVDGCLALAGRVSETHLARFLAHPFFAQPLPKSLDRQHFHTFLEQISDLSPEDGAATLTALTAESVAALSLPDSPRKWLICGGGRCNPAMMAALKRALSAEVMPVDQFGWNGDALEAQCFGFLAVRSRYGLPLSFPGTTGVPAPITGGTFFPAM